MYSVELFRASRETRATMNRQLTAQVEDHEAAKKLMDKLVVDYQLTPTTHRNCFKHKEYDYLLFAQPV